MSKVTESLKAVASFVVDNTQSVACKVGMFAGHYNTERIETIGDVAYIRRTNPKPLVSAGYQCDCVVDDFIANAKDNVTLNSKSPRTRFCDLVNYVRNTNLKVSKIRITDISESASTLFNQEIEFSTSQVNVKGPSDYLQLSTFVNPRNYSQNVIDIDLEENEIVLDETTVMIMTVPENCKFQIDFILGE